MHTSDKAKIRSSDIIIIFSVLGLAIIGLSVFGWVVFHYLSGSKRSVVGEVSLSEHYTASISDSTLDPNGNEGANNLAEFPSGVHRFAGVDFSVGGIIQLASKTSRHWTNVPPERVEGIKVGRKCRQLHLLHGAGFWSPDGVVVARLVLHYGNGKVMEIPISYGKHVRDWFQTQEDRPPVKGTQIAWTGDNEVAKSANAKLRIYKSTFDNPLPEELIQSMDYVSTLSDSAPFLLAVTVE